jgi:ankyrin repeat protein
VKPWVRFGKLHARVAAFGGAGGQVSAVRRADGVSLRLFRDAVRSGDVARVNLLVASGLVTPDSLVGRDPALVTAVRLGREEVVLALLGAGASPNLPVEEPRGWWGAAPSRLGALHYAAQNGNERMVQCLIDAGARVNVVGPGWVTAAHLAAEGNHVGVLRLLFAAGGCLGAERSDGGTPLHVGVRAGALDAVGFLLSVAGVDVDAVDDAGRSGLFLAAESSNVDAVKMLLNVNASVRVRARDKSTVLHAAVRGGDVDAVKLILVAGADVCAVSKSGDAALHLVRGDPSVTEVLLDAGANPNQVNKRGETPLHQAARYGLPDVVRVLLLGGADAGAVTVSGATPLMLASNKPTAAFECVRGLLGGGCGG